MEVIVSSSAEELGKESARLGADTLRIAISERGEASIIVATGVSQFATLAALLTEPDIDWTKVTGFHLDEYIGLPVSHPASFRGYLKKRLVDLVPLAEFHYIDGEGDAQVECDRLGDIICQHDIAVAFIGVGENGHLAFNDPPADFETERPYLIVDLDDDCRRQQSGEGWFATFDDVPRQAISMSVQQILKSRTIICSALEDRKAVAVQAALKGPITPDLPASILQQHPSTTIFLDDAAAARLERA
jgi:glucosamine-6-phosphate deaminase